MPKADRPPVRVVHLAFQTMVGCGSLMMFVAALGWSFRLLEATTARQPLVPARGGAGQSLGMVAIEAGWTVTEVGRQPWIIHKIMRTSEAVTPVAGLWVSMVSYTAIYLMLGVAVVLLLGMQFRTSPGADEQPALAGEGVENERDRDFPGGWYRPLRCCFPDALRPVWGSRLRRGVWHLLARGPRAEAQHDLIAHAIGPVWEANHVWLIIVIVLLFTGFPAAFALIMTDLHVPISLMLVGIVLRGSAFTFAHYDTTERGRELQGPYVSAPQRDHPRAARHDHRRDRQREADDPPRGRLPLVLVLAAPIPADGRSVHLGDFLLPGRGLPDLGNVGRGVQDDFRRRALVSAVLVGMLAYAVYLLARQDAPPRLPGARQLSLGPCRSGLRPASVRSWRWWASGFVGTTWRAQRR